MEKALYRKYRSRTFDEVVGQKQVTDVLARSVASGRVSHAYLFTGPRGTGKTSVARILAHAVNGFDYELEDDYLDIIEIDAASNTGVENIRELREKAIIAPSSGKYKVYIIDEVHMLSKSAFNALLKILEEPPMHVIFIMATTDAHKVPITIMSRAQKYVFQLSDVDTIASHLARLAGTEGIDITPDALELIARRGGGSFRDSISLLDQVSAVGSGQITRASIETMMGIPGEELVVRLLENYGGDNGVLLATLAELAATGIKPELVATELISKIVANPKSEYLPLLDKLTEVSGSAHPEVKLMLALVGRSFPEEASPERLPRAKSESQHLVSPTLDRTALSHGETTHSDEQVSSFSTSARSMSLGSPSEKDPSVPTVMNEESEVFSWDGLLEAARKQSLPLHSHLSKLDYLCTADSLTIYAKTKLIAKIIEKNREIIAGGLPEGMMLNILAEQKPKLEDDKVSAISAIMGGGNEVEEFYAF